MTKEIQPLSATPANFEHAQRVAIAWAKSELVPEAYRGTSKIANVLVAMEYANRSGTGLLMVMQNLHIIHGKPSPSSSFIIAAVEASGRFEPINFRLSGEGDNLSCVAYAKSLINGEVYESPAATIKMAKEEGWMDKKGSKWKTMPELMLRYRAAAFFGRLYAPAVLMGMQTYEERIDIGEDSSSARNASEMPEILRNTPPAPTSEPMADYEDVDVDVDVDADLEIE